MHRTPRQTTIICRNNCAGKTEEHDTDIYEISVEYKNLSPKYNVPLFEVYIVDSSEFVNE